MRCYREIAALLALSAAVLAGCAAEPAEVNEEQLADPELGGEHAGEAASAQSPCAPGRTWVPQLNFCLVNPVRVDPTPGAFGCTYGGAVSGAGNVICFSPPGEARVPPV